MPFHASSYAHYLPLHINAYASKETGSGYSIRILAKKLRLQIIQGISVVLPEGHLCRIPGCEGFVVKGVWLLLDF